MPARRRLLALTSLLALPVQAAHCPPLRLGILSFPGLNERGPDGRMAGFDAEIAAALSERSGCLFAIEESNPSRLWPLLSQGELPLTATLAYLPERREQVDYLILFRLRGFVLMGREQAERTPTRAAFDADPRLRLGVVRKAQRPPGVQAWVDSLSAQGRIVEASDSAGLQRVYEAGRVHAVLAFAGSLRSQPAEWQARQRALPWLPDYWQTFGWAVSRAAVPAATRERLQLAADSLRKDGTLQRLARAYWGGPGEPMFEVLARPPE